MTWDGYGSYLMPDGQIVATIDGLPPATAESAKAFQGTSLTSQNPGSRYEVAFEGKALFPRAGQWWKTDETGMNRLLRAGRRIMAGDSVRYIRFLDDYPAFPVTNAWRDTGVAGYAADKRYVVQTNPKIIERCLLMTTDPGDLVFDPTCGSGTTAFVAEQWGRRWITADTSRVAIAIARQRLLTSKYDFYRFKNEVDGLNGGFRYKTIPHVTLKCIAQNTNLDAITTKTRTRPRRKARRCKCSR